METKKYQVYIMSGAPGAGKSTWCRNHGVSKYRVSRDEIRFSVLKEGEDYFSHEKETFRMFIDAIKKKVTEYGIVFIDASHLEFYSRRKLFRALDDVIGGKYESYILCFVTPLRTCLERNALRQGRERVPDSVVNEFYYKATIPKKTDHPSIKGVWEIDE